MLTQACSGSPIVCQWTACVLSKDVVTRDFTTVCAVCCYYDMFVVFSYFVCLFGVFVLFCFVLFCFLFLFCFL